MATTMWTLLSILVIAPLGALAFDRPLNGNWIWHIDPEKARDSASPARPHTNYLGPIRSARSGWLVVVTAKVVPLVAGQAARVSGSLAQRRTEY